MLKKASFQSHPRARRKFKWIKMCPYLILVLLFAAQTEQSLTSVTMREGDAVALSCESQIDQVKCNRTTWLLTSRIGTNATDLVRFGQINKNQLSEAKSDRMSVAVNCSLMIQRVAAEDVGSYTCEQLSFSGQEQAQHTELSVVNITEHKHSDQVKLSCAVSTYKHCKHQVKWLLNNQAIEKENNDLKIINSNCSASVTFSTSHFINKSKDYNLLKCEVTESPTNVQHYTVRSPASGKKKQSSGDEVPAGKPSSGCWWRMVYVPVGVAALSIIVVSVSMWTRTKENSLCSH
ncbi:uncharacterized protein LOC121633504 isoform X2 [Melanotaenia boesemani]|uniref:uncharacterized protein LOC121633504 isoform X2 n=1 Tax=Melanotaenia boesemani TaxID=1250792 RepID=UPI001C049C10|nr:uncharacterized protein LOC121633504 isoform X2 [Melanotaenia boesemani]